MDASIRSFYSAHETMHCLDFAAGFSDARSATLRDPSDTVRKETFADVGAALAGGSREGGVSLVRDVADARLLFATQAMQRFGTGLGRAKESLAGGVMSAASPDVAANHLTTAGLDVAARMLSDKELGPEIRGMNERETTMLTSQIVLEYGAGGRHPLDGFSSVKEMDTAFGRMKAEVGKLESNLSPEDQMPVLMEKAGFPRQMVDRTQAAVDALVHGKPNDMDPRSNLASGVPREDLVHMVATAKDMARATPGVEAPAPNAEMAQSAPEGVALGQRGVDGSAPSSPGIEAASARDADVAAPRLAVSDPGPDVKPGALEAQETCYHLGIEPHVEKEVGKEPSVGSASPVAEQPMSNEPSAPAPCLAIADPGPDVQPGPLAAQETCRNLGVEPLSEKGCVQER